MSSFPFLPLIAAGAFALPLTAQQYNLAEIGSFVPDARQSSGLDINEQGQVVGRLVFGDERRILGFVWERGTVRRFLPQPHDPLERPPTLESPFHHVAPAAINDQGIIAGTALEIVGWSVSSGFFAEASAAEHAPLRTLHSLAPLQDLHVMDVSSSLPYRFVGTGDFTDPDTFAHRRRAFVTRIDPSIGQDDSALMELGTLGGDSSYAQAVNDLGMIVGGATNAAGTVRAFRSLDGAALEDLGTLGGPASHAMDVSENGVIVGWAELEPGLEHAFRWENGVMRDLGTLGGEWSRALGIDPTGELIVGASLDEAGQMRACLWRDGLIIDLNDGLPAQLGWALIEATAVNSGGMITGRGLARDGREQAFVLQPAPLELAPLAPNLAGVSNEMVLEGATPGTLVAFLHGDDAPGYVPVPGRQAGLLLNRVVLLGLTVADATGRAELRRDIPPTAAGLSYRMQALELRSLALSDVEIGVLR